MHKPQTEGNNKYKTKKGNKDTYRIKKDIRSFKITIYDFSFGIMKKRKPLCCTKSNLHPDVP